MAEINKKYCIYRRHLKNSNKNYIGYTSLTLNERAGRNGRKYASCSKFFDAILKYGWDAFESEILEDNLTLEEAINKEKYYIILFNSQENGFNEEYGNKHSQNTIQKMKDSHKTCKIKCIETNQIFNSIQEAKQILNNSSLHISEVINGKRKTVGGFHWEEIKEN